MSAPDPSNISADAAVAALAENWKREAQTIAAGSSPWPARGVIPVAVALPPLGYLIDVDLVWLFATLAATMAVLTATRRVQLRPDRRSARSDLLVLATLVVAFAANVAMQFAIRSADLPLPNMWGMAAAAVVVLLVVWPVQRRAAGRVSP